MQLAQQRAAEAQYARELNEAQRQIEKEAAPPIILRPEQTPERLGLPVDDGSGVPAHVDAGMLIDGAEMNRTRSIKKTESMEGLDLIPRDHLRVDPIVPRVRP
jgi:hypothetical protein